MMESYVPSDICRKPDTVTVYTCDYVDALTDSVKLEILFNTLFEYARAVKWKERGLSFDSEAIYAVLLSMAPDRVKIVEEKLRGDMNDGSD